MSTCVYIYMRVALDARKTYCNYEIYRRYLAL